MYTVQYEIAPTASVELLIRARPEKHDREPLRNQPAAANG